MALALSRDAILAADDLPRREVQVPEWGGSVWVRSLNLAERMELMKLATADRNITPEVVALCACDEAGVSLFGLADVEALKAKSGTALERIALEALRLNGMTREAAEAAEKN